MKSWEKIIQNENWQKYKKTRKNKVLTFDIFLQKTTFTNFPGKNIIFRQKRITSKITEFTNSGTDCWDSLSENEPERKDPYNLKD